MRKVLRGSGVSLALLVLLTLTGCSQPTTEEVDSEAVVAVTTVAAVRGDIHGVVHATGIVNPAPGADLVVIAPETARIAEIPHASGDRVRRGDVLVRFELPNAAADVQRQQAEISRAQATLENTRAALTRAQALFERGVAARREVEDAARQVADAEATLVQARASVAAAQTVAGRAVVRATFDGIVATRLHNPGDMVEATATDPVLRLIDPRRLEVVAAVPLADASRVDVGAAAHLASAAAGDPDVVLTVLSRPVAVDGGTATVPVRLGLPASAFFPAGTPVQVDIEAEHHTGVILVPAAAIVREGEEETAVFIAREGKARHVPVQVGLSDGARVEIVSGVAAGDQVIVDGQTGLPDGATITTRGEAGAAAPAAGPSPAAGGGK